ncbi:hypothetical protein B0H13DRAFT_2270560 [Mycena leptocephala]|nr:hypothetical protein B0H13DRAFT_2270560 [Mycena leptocephala]
MPTLERWNLKHRKFFPHLPALEPLITLLPASAVFTGFPRGSATRNKNFVKIPWPFRVTPLWLDIHGTHKNRTHAFCAFFVFGSTSVCQRNPILDPTLFYARFSEGNSAAGMSKIKTNMVIRESRFFERNSIAAGTSKFGVMWS